MVQCVANDSQYWPESGNVTVFQQNDENGNYEGHPRTAHMRSPTDWARDHNGYYQAYLTGRVSRIYNKAGTEQQLAENHWSIETDHSAMDHYAWGDDGRKDN